MLSSRAFLLRVCLSLAVYSGSSTCKPLSNDVESQDPEGLDIQLSDDDLLEKEDVDMRMENLLGNMKEGFLKKLNLSDVPQEHSKMSPPQFMMELYNKYAADRSTSPQSDVIRSFSVQDFTISLINGTKTKHRLQFNVTIPSHEKIVTSELQLFFFPDNTSITSSKSIVKVHEVGHNLTSTTLLEGKEVTSSHGVWASFDVTAAVEGWSRSGCGATVLDVVVDRKDCVAPPGGDEAAGCLNVSLSVGGNTSAAVIVFSDDLSSRRQENKKELREMIHREEEAILHSGADWNRGGDLPNEILEAQHPRRTKRKASGREYCRRTSLKVNFKDIGWDSWIVAPPEYDAYECRGLCYHPLTDESTPSKHALIQTLINIRDPGKANMACCVPIKLDPITVMYQENGRLTIRYLYEEMKVAECGCR
ncbi:growth differentiation factor 2 precursor [Cynoglossus semilaevis]|uniref:Dorsalin-1-like protein n=1 Tax=Cynoglossus semilaevis TaxID=244447 RepID=A0A0U1WUU0_CYNSE|nr:growth differentiation factor 2 precursor [Cynoglossus semilaevis]AHA15365.1 dorsalin-1-like protein [Cynoglossus semilaevis]